MRIYKYWARDSIRVPMRGQVWNIACFGSSNESQEDAARNARLRGESVKKAIMSGKQLGSYSYTDRPLREELKREVRQGDELVAVITRNSYGALVLNTARVMFIDIDVVPEHKMFWGPPLLTRLMFWKAKRVWDPVADKPEVLEGIRRKVRMYGLGMRVYRTPCGYRGLVTSHTFDPTSDETQALLTEFGSDQLYIKMCRAQECFRARLTPKPYRMGRSNPPYRFPWITDERMREHREWERDYEGWCADYSACYLVDHFGTLDREKDIWDIVRIHDAVSCTGGKLA